MATPSLRAKDYKAIGKYAEQHGLRLHISALPYISFVDDAGNRSSVLLSHIHVKVDEEKATRKNKK